MLKRYNKKEEGIVEPEYLIVSKFTYNQHEKFFKSHHY